MPSLVLRLLPGEDLRAAIEAAVARETGAGSAFVLSGIGSLSRASLRLAGAPESTLIEGDLELLTLAGSVTPDGAHLHASLARADGSLIGGHVTQGCVVRTTAELLLATLPQWQLGREQDPATGYAELVARRRS
ncbi:PPC domain-containing DNA-binding protein [Ideonella sp. YS5]|uniref:PPC domain-containing DNA-binding protein n=1 Tax=Ideonella sp. YS5 TaxID=3453714 RepID=UPI003EEFF3B7